MGTLADLAESGDADALSAAIADGAHLDEADDEGNTATHKAAQGEPECLRLLLSHGATVDGAAGSAPVPRASAVVEEVMPLMQQLVLLLSKAGEPMALSRQQTAMTLYLLECVLEKMSAEGS